MRLSDMPLSVGGDGDTHMVIDKGVMFLRLDKMCYGVCGGVLSVPILVEDESDDDKADDAYGGHHGFETLFMALCEACDGKGHGQGVFEGASFTYWGSEVLRRLGEGTSVYFALGL